MHAQSDYVSWLASALASWPAGVLARQPAQPSAVESLLSLMEHSRVWTQLMLARVIVVIKRPQAGLACAILLPYPTKTMDSSCMAGACQAHG